DKICAYDCSVNIMFRLDGYAYPVFVDLLDRMGTPTQYFCEMFGSDGYAYLVFV
nr:hypothetical protein [Tanacetum cinerariifolium]